MEPGFVLKICGLNSSMRGFLNFDSCKNEEGNAETGDYGPWLRAAAIRKRQYACKRKDNTHLETLSIVPAAELREKTRQVCINHGNVKPSDSAQEVRKQVL